MFGIGQGELLIVCLIGVLLFGHRLPELMRSLGQGIREFNREVQNTDNPFRDVR